jgi:hypothetical protein
MKIEIPIDGGSYVSESLPESAQKLVNAYVNIPQTKTITTASVYGTPGLTQLVKVSDIDRWRGSHEMAGLAYYVIGSKLYKLVRTVTGGVASYSTTDLGTISGDGLVSMDDNGTQLAIVVPGVRAYIYTEAAGLAEITDANFDGPVDWVRYINSYFTFGTTDGKKIIVSPPNDGRGSPTGTAYDALDFTVAEADPDNIVGAVNYANTLYVMGTQTTQAFQTIARTPAPIAPIQGSVLPTGAATHFGIVRAQKTFYMVGYGENEGPAIWRFMGNDYDKISTTAIDTILADLTDEEIASIDGWTYSIKGAYFVGWNLPETCIVYNLVTQKWHDQLSTYGTEERPWRAAGHIKAYGRTLVGDRVLGIIGEIDKDVYNEYGNKIKRRGVTRPFDNQGEHMPVGVIEAVMETGVGNSTVEDPQIRLSYSDDGARTFNNERSRSFGKVGEYWIRPRWERNGGFPRSRVLQWEFSEEAKFVLIKLEADIG